MSKLVTKLNLNRTPQSVDNGSFVYAENIKLLENGTITEDGFFDKIFGTLIPNPIQHRPGHIYEYLGHVVGINNKVYFFVKSRWTISTYDIFEYDEINDTLTVLDTAWTYSGGKIGGYTTINNCGDIILTVNEYFENEVTKLIPLKHINITKSVANESLYTQAPIIPILNLVLTDTYARNIPNGVYQFFVRYKIAKDDYTSWMPCSKELFAGTTQTTETIQGSIKFMKTTKDAAKSFVFSPRFNIEDDEYEDATKYYKEFQLGFILSNDDTVVARSWKSFTFNVDSIYFTYNEFEVEEINIDDLLRPVYELYNVKNVTSFKNKLYISNYIESDFNPKVDDDGEDIQAIASGIDIDINISDLGNTETPSSNMLQLGNYLLIKSGTTYYNVLTQAGGMGFPGLYKSDKDNDTTRVESKAALADSDILWKVKFKTTDHNYEDLYVPRSLDNIIYPIKSEYGENVKEGNITILTNSDKFNDSVSYFRFVNYDGIAYLKLNSSANLFGGLGIADDMFIIGPTFYCDPDDVTIITDAWERRFKDRADLIKYLKINPSNDNKTLTWQQSGGAGAYSEDIEEYLNGDKSAGTMNPKIIKNVMLNVIKPKIPNYMMLSIYYIYDGTKHFIEGIDDNNLLSTVKNNNVDFRGTLINSSEENLVNDFISIISKHIKGVYLDSSTGFKYVIECKDGTITYDFNNSLFVEYSTFNCEAEVDTSQTSGSDTTCDININVTRTNHTLNITNKLINTLLEAESSFIQYRTLMPFVTYEFYAHYVKNNGIVTNGYYIGEKTLADFTGYNYSNIADKSRIAIYPSFDDIYIPSGYASMFISIFQSKREVAQCFDVFVGEKSNNKYPIELNCLELDCALYNVLENIQIIGVKPDGTIIEFSDLGEYYPSYKIGTAGNIKRFGGRGVIVANIKDTEWKEFVGDNVSIIGRLWIKIETSANLIQHDKKLIRCTPYIYYTEDGVFGELDDDVFSFDNFEIMNLPAYLCSVRKPNRDADSKYVANTDVYSKDPVTLSLDDINNVLTPTSSDEFIINSQFNLNYLSLTEDLVDKIRNLSTGDNTRIRHVMLAINSFNISEVYTHPEMYRHYTRPSLYPIESESIVNFTNSVRASDILSDESRKNIYKFYSEDVYYIPANRGEIVKLFSNLNNVYVHCKHGLYKFDGANKLHSENEQDVQLTETDIFSTGIHEIFDSEFGYAGLAKKEHSIVTFNSYVFYDEIVNKIYVFDGNSQISPISDPISDIIRYLKVNYESFDVRFAADEVNNRFFVCFIVDDVRGLCLSYNTLVKSFISIHDFIFDVGFSTRGNTYFVKTFSSYKDYEGTDIYVPNSYCFKYNTTGIRSESNNKRYNKLYSLNILSVSDSQNDNTENDCSIVDIIFNDDFEKIKRLNFIRWICSKFLNFNSEELNVDENTKISINAAEPTLDRYYAGNYIRIYTDSTFSEKINIRTRSNESSINDLDSYNLPRYNNGIWALNGFGNADEYSNLPDGKFLLNIILNLKTLK